VAICAVYEVPDDRGSGPVDAGEDVLAGQHPVVAARAHGVKNFGGQYVIVSVGEELAEQVPGDLLAGAARVHVGGVKERDPGFNRLADDGLGLLLA
jgi:hypothetical protein